MNKFEYTKIGSSFGLTPLSMPCYNSFKNKKVETKLNNEFAELSANLAALAVKNTSAVVYKKIKAVKTSKDDKQTIAELTDIINELIDENQELTMISKGFEKELVSQQLSDSDIKTISDNVVPVLKEFAEKQGDSGKEMLESIDMIKPVISKETIGILQILGFNFKKSIGEPLTDLLNNKIKSFESKNNDDIQLALLQRETEYYKLMQNEKALQNIREFKN
ncbi:hypothetical protein R82291_FJPPFKPJ_00703 [Fructobacillus cardui]|uniref:hypothetical protein n=1 Tax=Fructobacillus cardui TaxID=2893170 RepID=UPI002D8661D7|nr:hypothetical protein R82291_FJPPFKPJ_00703 [Fructobacillus cardui]